MDVYEAITTLRAIRRYTDAPITDEEILHCLRAAQQGPSGGNIQPWQFLVVTEPPMKRGIADIYRRAYDRYEPALMRALPGFRSEEERERFDRMARSSRHLADHLADAPAIVLALMPNISMTLQDDQGPLDVGTPYASVYPAVQNFMLAARGLGIGTALTTVFRIYQDDLRSLCGVPSKYEIVALIPMGRPKGKFGVAPRRPVEQVTHWNRFGERRQD